jgi:glycosyltransferase involved in cell wall biosynthesis
MLVTVVTPSFNKAAFIEKTIKSVLNQDYPHIEYIVIDGDSTDGTQNILRKYDGKLQWYRESDTGQSQAINRGFLRAKGDIIAWLNADDCYVETAISQVVDYFVRNPGWTFLYGDALAINQSGWVFGNRTNVKQTDYANLLVGDSIVQPAAFWRSSIWQQIGPLREDLHFVQDYDYWLRIAKLHSLHYVPVVLAKERLYGGAKTFSGKFERWQEMQMMIQSHGLEQIPLEFWGEIIATQWLSQQHNHPQLHQSASIYHQCYRFPRLWLKVCIYYLAGLILRDRSVPFVRLLDSFIRGRYSR